MKRHHRRLSIPLKVLVGLSVAGLVGFPLVRWLSGLRLENKVTAADGGPVDRVREALAQGANPNIADEHGTTPLILGCLYDDRPLVQVALAHGARVNVQNRDGYTPLMLAASNEDTDIVQSLLEHGANVNTRVGDGYTALRLAILGPTPSADVVKILLEHGGIVNSKNSWGDSPLMVLIGTSPSSLAVAKVLLEHHADMHVRDYNGNSALQLAVMLNRPDLVKILLEHGAPVNVTNNYGDTPLKEAFKASSPDLIRLLKHYGAKGKSMTTRKRAAVVILALLLVLIGVGGWSVYRAVEQARKNVALIAAIRRFDAKTVEALLDEGADASAKDTIDRRALWQRVRDLVLHRPPPGKGLSALAVTMQGFVSYEIVSRYDYRGWKRGGPILLALIQHGADPNISDEGGMTPLMWACAYDDKPLVQMALEHGAKVNTQAADGKTALMWAAEDGTDWQGAAETVQTLLVHGANVNIEDETGDTALLWALRGHISSSVVKLLLQGGAHANAKDMYDLTPLNLADGDKLPDLVSLLKQYGAKE